MEPAVSAMRRGSEGFPAASTAAAAAAGGHESRLQPCQWEAKRLVSHVVYLEGADVEVDRAYFEVSHNADGYRSRSSAASIDHGSAVGCGKRSGSLIKAKCTRMALMIRNMGSNYSASRLLYKHRKPLHLQQRRARGSGCLRLKR